MDNGQPGDRQLPLLIRDLTAQGCRRAVVSSLNGHKSGRILDPVVAPAPARHTKKPLRAPFGSRRLVDGLACAPYVPGGHRPGGLCWLC
jgi:hypothetical protein